MMSERKSIENSRKRYQTFITSERKPKNVPTAAAATLLPAAILPAAATLSPAAISPAAATLSPAAILPAAATLSSVAMLPAAATLSSAAAVANLSLKKAVAANL